MMEATETTATVTGRQRQTDDPLVHRKNDGAGGKYRAGGSKTEKSTDESDEWGGEEMQESASEKD